jgi:hypothetical protein
MQNLETLIRRYEDAIFDPLFDPDTCALLCQQVERAAAHRTDDAMNHRLYALHTAFERAALAQEARR